MVFLLEFLEEFFIEELGNALPSNGTSQFIVRLNIKLDYIWVTAQIRENAYTRNGYFRNGANYVLLEDVFVPNVTGNVTLTLQANSFEQLVGGMVLYLLYMFIDTDLILIFNRW